MLIDIRENVGRNQTVSRKHFLSNQDIRNIKRSVLDSQTKRHENDAMSVSIIVQELQAEPYNPILINITNLRE